MISNFLLQSDTKKLFILLTILQTFGNTCHEFSYYPLYLGIPNALIISYISKSKCLETV